MLGMLLLVFFIMVTVFGALVMMIGALRESRLWGWGGFGVFIAGLLLYFSWEAVIR